jgi:hypothetical protein
MHTTDVWRPPISAKRQQMIAEMAQKLNEDALFPLSWHNVLDACIDRAYAAMFPEKPVTAKRKAYIRLEY